MLNAFPSLVTEGRYAGISYSDRGCERGDGPIETLEHVLLFWGVFEEEIFRTVFIV